jgi:hypothetical protein
MLSTDDKAVNLEIILKLVIILLVEVYGHRELAHINGSTVGTYCAVAQMLIVARQCWVLHRRKFAAIHHSQVPPFEGSQQLLL